MFYLKGLSETKINMFFFFKSYYEDFLKTSNKFHFEEKSETTTKNHKISKQ